MPEIGPQSSGVQSARGFWALPAKNRLYKFGLRGDCCIFDMHDTNLALWGLWVVPLGLAICFSPALFVWLKEELKADDENKKK